MCPLIVPLSQRRKPPDMSNSGKRQSGSQQMMSPASLHEPNPLWCLTGADVKSGHGLAGERAIHGPDRHSTPAPAPRAEPRAHPAKTSVAQ